MPAYTTEVCSDEFAAACDCFQELMGELRSESTRLLHHVAIESLIGREGTELLRLLMQGCLDRRSAAEEKLECVTGADGEERRHCRARSRLLRGGHSGLAHYVFRTAEDLRAGRPSFR